MGTWLRTCRTWLWKEWRDQRAITIGILLAIPGLTALAFWAFGEHLATAWLHTTRAAFLGIALGLVNFAVAAALFAGERRGQTLSAIQRLPHALSASLVAKLTYLLLFVVLVIAWQGLCLALAEAGNGGIALDLGFHEQYDGGPIRAMALLEQLAQFPTGELWVVGFGMGVICLWTLLVSTWMGRSGVAGIGAVVLLGALGTPFLLFFQAHPYFFPGPWTLAGWTAVVAALVALAALLVSYLRGNRYAGRPFRACLYGMALVLIALGGGYAYAQQRLDDWLDIDADDPDLRIAHAYVGAGGRRLYLTVHRGTSWIGDRPTHGQRKAGWEQNRGTPLQAWVVDLATNMISKQYGREAHYFMDIPEAARGSLEPRSALVCYRLERPSQADDKSVALTWWDAESGKPVRTLPADVRDPITIDLVRKALCARTRHRDHEGRRVWLRGGVVEREGALSPPRDGLQPYPERTHWWGDVPGGWYGMRIDEYGRGKSRFFLSADTGELRELPPLGRDMPYAMHILSDEHALGSAADPRRGSKDRKAARRLRLMPLAGGELVDPKNMPDDVGQVIGRNEMLVLRGPKEDRALHVWNPVTGADRALAWQGAAPKGIAHVSLSGGTGDGRTLLNLVSADNKRRAYALLTPDQHVHMLLDWHELFRGYPIALLEDNSLVIAEFRMNGSHPLFDGYARVVRYAPGKAPEVVFPR